MQSAALYTLGSERTFAAQLSKVSCVDLADIWSLTALVAQSKWAGFHLYKFLSYSVID